MSTSPRRLTMPVSKLTSQDCGTPFSNSNLRRQRTQSLNQKRIALSASPEEHQENVLPLASPTEDHPHLAPPSATRIPKQVSQIVGFLRKLQAGIHPSSGEWSEFPLEQEHYRELQHQLDLDKELSGYVRNKLRYDYEAKFERFSVRMPGRQHEKLLSLTRDCINDQIKHIAGGLGPAAIFAREISEEGSSRVLIPTETEISRNEGYIGDESETEYSTHMPDATWYHSSGRYPVVILEIVYSCASAYDKAEDYILNSRGSVQVVAIIDVDYNSDKESTARNAKLSVYRPHLQNDVLEAIPQPDEEVFYREGRVVDNHPGLCLDLTDFGYDDLIQNIRTGDNPITISAQKLVDHIEAARAPRLAGERVLPSNTQLKRRRPREDDASRTEGQRKKAKRRAANEDPDYVP